MSRTLLLIASIALVCLPVAAIAETVTEDFEDMSSEFGWHFMSWGDIIQPEGGNPGAWLNNPEVMTFGPQLRCDYNAPVFTGNFREVGVTMISLDARTDYIDWGSMEIEMSILLRDTNGTPGNVDDDDYAYYPGPICPQPGQGWLHYDFEIPSDSTESHPAGWWGGWVGNLEDFRPGIDWNDVIVSVDRVEIWWWHPAYFGIMQTWNVGADNISITYEGTSPVESSTWGQIKALYSEAQ